VLQVREGDGRARVWRDDADSGCLCMVTRAGADAELRLAQLNAWYRDEVRRAAAPMIVKWEREMRVSSSRLDVQTMRTRWGTCNTVSGVVRLNSELAKKPPACLEYVVVHELTHLLERGHTPRFYALMDGFMPDWRALRDKLNTDPSGAPALV